MFKDREQAGILLALKLKKILRIAQDDNFMTIPLLRGGIVLGKKVSDYFKIPLFPLSVKKIGASLNPELAIGAVTFDKTSYINNDLIKNLHVDKGYIKNTLNEKWKEARDFQKRFGLKESLKGKKVIIIDDGIATGTTAICASVFCKKQGAKEIILATPVIAKESFNNIKRYFDSIISLKKVDNLVSVSQFYEYFPQVEDDEVVEILNRKE